MDHLIFQLYVRKFGGAVPSNIEGRAQFPIFDSPGLFKKIGAPRTVGLDKADRDAICGLQPYQPGDEGRHHRDNLGVLNTLHNIDKHRKLHLVSSLQSAIRKYEFPPEAGFSQKPVWGSKESHDQVDTWTFATSPSEMQEHEGARIDVGIEIGDDADQLIPLLFELSEAVAYVLRQFADRFPAVRTDGRKRSLYADSWHR